MADTPIAIRPFVAASLAPVAEIADPDNVRVVLYTGTQQVHVPLKELLKFSPTPPPSVPAGLVAPFAMKDPPSGWLACNGAAVSRQDYADLFSAIGTTWGKGDDSTTFNVPDFQGQFLRGWPGGNVDPDRAFGSKQSDAIRNITGSSGFPVDGSIALYESGKFEGAFYTKTPVHTYRKLSNVESAEDADTDFPLDYNFDAGRVVPVANENRPVNISVLFCIKT